MDPVRAMLSEPSARTRHVAERYETLYGKSDRADATIAKIVSVAAAIVISLACLWMRLVADPLHPVGRGSCVLIGLLVGVFLYSALREQHILKCWRRWDALRDADEDER